MQTEYALLLDKPVVIGNYKPEGQVLLPVVQVRNIRAPSKRNPHYRINVDLVIPSENAPGGRENCDIRWLWPGGAGCLLKDIQALLVFNDGTLTNVAPEPQEPSV